MLIDTHSHVSLVSSVHDWDSVLERARMAGVVCGLITTGSDSDFEVAREAAHQYHWGYCVGIHPLFIDQVHDNALVNMERFLENHFDDPHLIGIGEIGLDLYEGHPDYGRQLSFFRAQMALAEKFSLPVSVHARRALSRVIEVIDEFGTVKGAVHAFPGSAEQAREVIARGYGIGFGGAVTYEGSKKLRKCAVVVPEDVILLESDAPDMPPSYRRGGQSEPSDLFQYLQILSSLRAQCPKQLEERVFKNSLKFFPRLRFFFATSAR